VKPIISAVDVGSSLTVVSQRILVIQSWSV
jgi:hypothetical protein